MGLPPGGSTALTTALSRVEGRPGPAIGALYRRRGRYSPGDSPAPGIAMPGGSQPPLWHVPPPRTANGSGVEQLPLDVGIGVEAGTGAGGGVGPGTAFPGTGIPGGSHPPP